MTLKLNSITISRFQNLGESQTIQFDSPGIYSFIGRNLDESGASNGSGKTAVTRAITAGLLGTKYLNITNKEIKSRVMDGAASIIQDWTINDKSVIIDRTIGGKLSISIDGEALVGKTDEIQQKFIDFVGISPEHLLYLTHKMQGISNSFLLMKDEAKKDFLSSFFDTSYIDKLNVYNDSQLKKYNSELSSKIDSLRVLTGKMSVLKNDVDNLTERTSKYRTNEFTSYVANMKSNLLQKEAGLRELLSVPFSHVISCNPEYAQLEEQSKLAAQDLLEHNERNTTVRLQITSNINELKDLLKQPVIIPDNLTAQLKECEQQLYQLTAYRTTAGMLNNKLANAMAKHNDLELKMSSIHPSNCHTCGQAITGEIYQNLKAKAELEMSKHRDVLQSIQRDLENLKEPLVDENTIINNKNTTLTQIAQFKALNDRSSLQSQLSVLESQLKYENERTGTLTQNAKNLARSVETMFENLKRSYNLEVAKLENEIKAIKNDLVAVEKDVKTSNELLESANKNYGECVQDVINLEKDIHHASSKITVHTKASEILSRNGFVGYIFDNILEEINQLVNEDIKKIPVISRLSLSFLPDKAIKSTGAISKSIVYEIKDNNGEVSYDTLSGAEQQSLMAIVDAAVDLILCSRLGVNINYKILDEQFGWVDGDNREHLLEFLRFKYQNKTLLFVDHGSEFNAAIDKHIIITKQDGIATITCQTAV